jgi:alanine dehydrogenase
MPGAVARTSSLALNNATLPYVIRLADHGLNALKQDPHFMAGLNISQGRVTYKPVADDLDLEFTMVEEALL